MGLKEPMTLQYQCNAISTELGVTCNTHITILFTGLKMALLLIDNTRQTLIVKYFYIIFLSSPGGVFIASIKSSHYRLHLGFFLVEIPRR